MRVFALSDLHIDYEVNAKWVGNVSTDEYRHDVLILAGDITDRLDLLEWCISEFVRRFRKVLYVPGNHELWVIRDDSHKHSLQKFEDVCKSIESSGASMQSYQAKNILFCPLLGWYDYSFGSPSSKLCEIWMDFQACRWPEGFDAAAIAAYFEAVNFKTLIGSVKDRNNLKTITYSHFLPRIDLMPWYIPKNKQLLYPILGSSRLDAQLRRLGSSIHVYGHSHVNRDVEIDGVRYINNAFGYPSETAIASKQMVCIHEC